MDTLTFAYYCSGHGYGHATRVSAFARHLLSLPLSRRLTVHIVSSAPEHVFADSIALGALYRCAEIDPIIVQPLAYRVDREKSVQVLENFLKKKAAMLDRERRWLTEIGANCVLSDAAFLGCLAAKTAGIPSILITNFTFDSVYSYLATSLVDTPSLVPSSPSDGALSPSSSVSDSELLLPDVPIAEATLAPLVTQLHDGYQHADLLLRLPGHIPIPSFFPHPPLPSPQWVNPIRNRFSDNVTQHLLSSFDSDAQLLLQPSKPFPRFNVSIPRLAFPAPLLVRPPSPAIHTPEGRAEFLKKTGLPNFEGMKILVVSFGGQTFKRPGGSRTASRMQSRNQSQETLAFSSLPSALKADCSADSCMETSQRTNEIILEEYHGPLKNSTSLGDSALKPVDSDARPTSVVAGGHSALLDLEALNRGLQSYVPQERSPSAGLQRRSLSTRQPNHKFYYDESHDDISCIGDNCGQLGSDQDLSGDSSFSSFNGAGTTNSAKRRHSLPSRRDRNPQLTHRRLATASHILIPGAPGPAIKPTNMVLRSPSFGKKPGGRQNAVGIEKVNNGNVGEVRVPEICRIPPTPSHDVLTNGQNNTSQIDVRRKNGFIRGARQFLDPSSADNVGQSSGEAGYEEGLLPDETWVAVICGVSKEQWNAENEDGGLPEGFYVAPRDVYMPDLIALGDVVLGKLGYGMTSECVDACTPFVYVSRPLFIEEHGLRIYLEKEGVGVELERAEYENGVWAGKVEEAYIKGQVKKEEKRRRELEFYSRLVELGKRGISGSGDDEQRLSERERQGREMARGVIEWVDGVWELLLSRQQEKDRMGASQAARPMDLEEPFTLASIERNALLA